jgi:hypothetical protein
MLVGEIWKFIHPRVSYSLRAIWYSWGNKFSYFLNPYAINVLLYRMKPRKHIHVKYYWQTYFKSIGTLSQTFKNHIHNNKEIQDQYPGENKVLFTGRWIVICAIHRWKVLFRQIEWNYGNGMCIAIKFI